MLNLIICPACGFTLQVLCLQEVQEDHYKDTFLPQLQQHGEWYDEDVC